MRSVETHPILIVYVSINPLLETIPVMETNTLCEVRISGVLTKPINNSRSLVLSNFDILHFHQLGQTSSFKTLSITYWQQGSKILETGHCVSVSSPSLVDWTLKWWEGAYGLQGPTILGKFIKSTSRLCGSYTHEGEFQVSGWSGNR